MRALRYVICDVFTGEPLTGNPLAVFTNAQGLSSASMQALAREMNLSTTFVLPPAAGGHARVRIFTPSRELPFAGHPTLGTALVLGAGIESDSIRLELDTGLVPVSLERDGARPSFGWMEQPLPSFAPIQHGAAVLRALGLPDPSLPLEEYHNGPYHLLVEAPSLEALTKLRPDLAALASITRGTVSVFARTADGFRSRVFCPAEGIDEDPASGSAAGPLAVHLARHGVVEWGRTVRITQGVELNRPSELLAEAHGTRDRLERVRVGGAGVIVARGEFRLPLPTSAAAALVH